MTTEPRLLIDGDQFLFKACAAVEKEVQWDEWNHVLSSNFEEARDKFKDMLDRVFDRFNSHLYVLCFTSSPTFRTKIDPTYKAGRTNRKPLCYARLREWSVDNYKTQAVPGLEADDVMGILATQPDYNIIVSQDKDMKTIPATVWNGVDLVTYSEAEADYWHLYQTLVGDTTDGYKGCPGVGPVKAAGIINSAYANGELVGAWAAVVKAYEKAGLTEADALTQARLARILRWSDWDRAKKEPILWTPQ